MSTIFGKILAGELPSQRVYEDEKLIVIKDINPVAAVHLLLIPRKEYASIQDVPASDLSIVAHIVSVAQEMAQKFGVEKGYRLITNCGESAGQTIFHLHFHLIGGQKLGAMA